MVTRINFNGSEYNSPEDMPPDVRQAYQQAMELLQQEKLGGRITPHVNVKVSTNIRFVHDGKTYNSLDEMPPEARQKYESAMQRIDKDHNGIPDFLEGDSPTPAARPTDDFSSTSSPSVLMAPQFPQPPVLSPDTSGNRGLLVAGLIIAFLLLIVLGLVLYILYR